MDDAADDAARRTQRIAELKTRIREAGDRLDTYRAKTAAALGAAVFLFLLAIGGLYDLLKGNVSIQIALGIGRLGFIWLTSALTLCSLVLFVIALLRERRHDSGNVARLQEWEEELAELLDQQSD